MKNKDTQLLEEAYEETNRSKSRVAKTIPANIPGKFTIGHSDTPAAHAVFDFLRWQCGLDFDMDMKRQGHGYNTTFTFKGPFTKKEE